MSDTPFEQMARNAQIAQNNRDIRDMQKARRDEGKPVSRRDAAALVAQAKRDKEKAGVARIGELVANAQPAWQQESRPDRAVKRDATIPEPKVTADMTDPHVIPRRERGRDGEKITVLAVQITGTTFDAIQMDVRSENYAAYP